MLSGVSAQSGTTLPSWSNDPNLKLLGTTDASSLIVHPIGFATVKIDDPTGTEAGIEMFATGQPVHFVVWPSPGGWSSLMLVPTPNAESPAGILTSVDSGLFGPIWRFVWASSPRFAKSWSASCEGATSGVSTRFEKKRSLLRLFVEFGVWGSTETWTTFDTDDPLAGVVNAKSTEKLAPATRLPMLHVIVSPWPEQSEELAESNVAPATRSLMTAWERLFVPVFVNVSE